MTKRTELQQRIAETKATLMTHVANRVFSSRQSGLDGLAKRVVLGKKTIITPDPDLSHSELSET